MIFRAPPQRGAVPVPQYSEAEPPGLCIALIDEVLYFQAKRSPLTFIAGKRYGFCSIGGAMFRRMPNVKVLKSIQVDDHQLEAIAALLGISAQEVRGLGPGQIHIVQEPEHVEPPKTGE